MMKKWIFGILIITLLHLLNPYLHALDIPSDKDYMQMSSYHFTIIYHTKSEKARKILAMAEKIHQKLAHKFRVHNIHTYIILVDQTDFANGLASIFPSNHIIVYDVPPELFTQISILNYYNWVEQVLVHEYSHILLMNQARDITELLQSINYNFLNPNIFLPLSCHEGVAVSMETHYTPMGRARSSYKNMVLRTAVHENKIPDIDEISTFVNKIPSGYGPYLWGGSFHYYLINKVGEDQVMLAYHKNSGCISSLSGCASSGFFTALSSAGTCFPLNGLVKNTTGKSYYTHYDDWTSEIKQKYDKEIAQINQPTIPKFIDEVKEFWTIFDINCNTNEILFSGYSPHTGYGVYRYHLKSKTLDIVIKDRLFTDVIVYADFYYLLGVERYDNVYNHLTLYKYDFESKDMNEYKDLKRILDVATRRNMILFFQIKDNEKVVRLLNLKNDKIETVLKLGKFEQAYDFTFNNDYEFFFVGKKENDFFDIYQYDIRYKELKRITKNPAIELSLFYHENENRLYFISDYNGIYNFYYHEIVGNKYYQLTDFITGASRFTKIKDNYFTTYYKSDGYTLGLLKDSELKRIEVPYNDEGEFLNYVTQSTENIVQEEAKTFGESEYSYFSDLFAHPIIFPQIMAVDKQAVVGLHCWFADILYRNNLQIGLEYYTDKEKIGGTIDYNMYRNVVDYNLLVSLYYDGETDNFKRYEKAKGKVTFFKDKILDYSALYTGLQYYKKTYIDLDIYQFKNSLFLGVIYNSSKMYAYSILPEKGWYWFFEYNFINDMIGASYDLDLLNISITKYYKLFLLHDVLRLNVLGGAMLNGSGDMGYTINGIDSYISKSTIYELSLNAYSDVEQDGKNIFIGNISYNIPLFWIERGIKNMPFLFRNIWLKAYYEAGNTFNRINKINLLDLAGGELHVGYISFYQIYGDLIFGFSQELQRDKASYLYFKTEIYF